VNHLADKENVSPRIFFKGLVGDFNGVFYAKTKAKMTGNLEFYWTEINLSWAQVLFARIGALAVELNSTNAWATIK
jgi:hypothetical protein